MTPLPLGELWWKTINSFRIDLDYVDALTPTTVLIERKGIDRELAAAGIEEGAGGLPGAIRVHDLHRFEFGILFGLAVGQHIAHQRTLAGDGPSVYDLVTPESAIECWTEAGRIIDRHVRQFHPTDEVKAAEDLRLYGPPEEHGPHLRSVEDEAA